MAVTDDDEIYTGPVLMIDISRFGLAYYNKKARLLLYAITCPMVGKWERDCGGITESTTCRQRW